MKYLANPIISYFTCVYSNFSPIISKRPAFISNFQNVAFYFILFGNSEFHPISYFFEIGEYGIHAPSMKLPPHLIQTVAAHFAECS